MSNTMPATQGGTDEYRLPTNVKPTHYDVTVRTDLEKLEFDGFVKVHLDIVEETSTLVFNSANLELGNASIYQESTKSVQEQSSRTIDEKAERVQVAFAKPLPAGSSAQLQLGFSGKLTGSMLGYYRSEWEHEGKKKYYTLTQFEFTVHGIPARPKEEIYG